MRPDRDIERVYLHRAPVDFRKRINGLSAIVESAVQANPFSGALFIFVKETTGLVQASVVRPLLGEA